MAEEQSQESKDKGKAKAKVEDVAEESTKESSQVDQREELDPRQVSQMLKMLGLSADAVTIPGTTKEVKKEKDKNQYKFWKTQPVPSFEEVKTRVPQEGPIMLINKDKISKDVPKMALKGFKWVTLDLTKDTEVKEVYELLSNHYVEDEEAMFRFNYSETFLNWALKAPGWRKEWHAGIRIEKDDGSEGKLLAFISGIPIDLRVRQNKFKAAEVNYLCVHKKLRNKRLAPELIKEVTRRVYLEGIFQAIYTAGVVVPSPLSTCRYYHRTLDFDKLYEVGFSPLPNGVSRQRQALKFKLPTATSTPGIRPMETKDIKAVGALLKKYLNRFDIAQDFSAEEIDHWFMHQEGLKQQGAERVIWTYVVETNNKITDFFSFYRLESTVIKTSSKHKIIKAAYLYYYATEAAFKENGKNLKPRLNELIKDLLILAKQVRSIPPSMVFLYTCD
jgi:glycylpeptide N-tetradecanoyltransferase